MADQEFDDDFDFDLPTAPTASHSTVNKSNDKGAEALHKGWTAIYPIYFDAKRKFGNGARRVNYEKSSLFPQSLHIANVANRMGWKIVHEVHKTHPQDWENPGRVKVCIDDLVNGISGKRALINALALGVQSFSGKPPPLPKIPSKKEKKEASEKEKESTNKVISTSTSTKSKKSNSKSKTKPKKPKGPLNPLLARNKLLTYPDVKDRLPPHSPAQEAGIISGNGQGGDMGSMGGMGGMLGAMLGGDDDDDEDDKKKKGIQEKEETEEERKKREWEELQRKEREKYGMGGRRGRKKMVRVGR